MDLGFDALGAILRLHGACPVRLTHPGADRWTSTAVSRAFFDRITAPTRFIELEGAGHFPVKRPGIDQLISALVELRDLVADATAGPHTS